MCIGTFALIVVATFVATIVSAWIGLVLLHARPLLAFWREPVFTAPIVVFESDDWGPGPPEHAESLTAIAALLGEFADRRSHPPVMTLGVVLATPSDNADGSGKPHELTLLESRYERIVAAMQAGLRAGVFQLQLHGRSHYWLPALIEARRIDEAVALWLAGSDTWRSEALPAELQSRWAPEIVGQPYSIPDDTVRAAAEEEARLFHQCFCTSPVIAVPTTFVWNTAAEQGWAAAGVRAVVTPGRYYRHRGQFADPGSVPLITNGMRSASVTYVVRDRYFEPFKGHSAEDGLCALSGNTALGRPTLLEIHRLNFLEPTLRDRSLSAMRDLLSRAVATCPDLRFVSTVEVVDAIEAESSDLIDRSMRGRVVAWCARVRTLPRFWKLARLSGLGFLVVVAERLSLDRG